MGNRVDEKFEISIGGLKLLILCKQGIVQSFDFFLGPFAVGDVMHHSYRTNNSAGLIPEVPAFFMDNTELAI